MNHSIATAYRFSGAECLLRAIEQGEQAVGIVTNAPDVALAKRLEALQQIADCAANKRAQLWEAAQAAAPGLQEG